MSASMPMTIAPMVGKFSSITKPVVRFLEFFSPVADLAIRLWVANVFWNSGVVKFQSFESTVLLFTYEYQVPFLSPEVAAYAGTFTELLFPLLLAFGLLTRFGAAVLFIFNIIAVVSYPGLGAPGLEQHQVWGLMLLVTLLHGPGKLSLDHLLVNRFLGNR